MITIAFAYPALMRHCISKNLEETDCYRVLLHASDGDDLIQKLAFTDTLPDICIIGAATEGFYHKTIKQLKAEYPMMKILVLTMSHSPLALMFMVNFGANGFINANCDTHYLGTAISDIYSGCFCYQTCINKRLNSLWEKRTNGRIADIFSKCEYKAMELFCEGYVTKEIAHKLGVSYNTVGTHIKRICSKLNIATQRELLLCLYEAGFYVGQKWGGGLWKIIYEKRRYFYTG